MINTIREKQSSVLVLDLGNAFPGSGLYPNVVADVSLEAMEIMKYDVMNLGEYDLKLGTDFLVQTADKISFSYLSSNIVHKEAVPIKPYVIKHIGDKSIAFLGLMPPTAFNGLSDGSMDDTFKIISPETAIKSLLPEIIPIADYIILISRLSINETEALLPDFKDIDLVITPKGQIGTEHDGAVAIASNPNSKIVSCSAETDVTVLEMLSVTLEEGGNITINNKEEFELNDTVPHDEQIDELIIGSYYERLKEEKRKRFARQLKEHHKSLKEGLNKTPEEFMREQNAGVLQTPSQTPSVNEATP